MSYKSVPKECPTRVSYKSVPQECPTRVSHKSFREECPTRVSYKSGPQECPIRVSHKSVPQEFPTRVSYKSFLQEWPTRVSYRVSRKSVLQECPLDILVFRSCLHSGSWVPSCFIYYIISNTERNYHSSLRWAPSKKGSPLRRGSARNRTTSPAISPGEEHIPSLKDSNRFVPGTKGTAGAHRIAVKDGTDGTSLAKSACAMLVPCLSEQSCCTPPHLKSNHYL